MVNLASPKTFEIVEYVLEKKKFTQYRASKDLPSISFGLINKVVNWLLGKQFVVRKEEGYVLRDAAGILSAISLYRDMNSLKLFEFSTSLTQKDLINIIPKSAVFCLDSALSQWSNYYKSSRVCAYLSQKQIEPIKKKLFFKPGSKSMVCFYKEQPKAKKKAIKGKNYTAKVRTVIDLACDGRIFAAETLFKELWSEKL